MVLKCVKPGCKQKAPIERCEDEGSKDKGSTGRMLVHARSCWGKDKVDEVQQAGSAKEAEAHTKKQKQGTLMVYYENARGKGQLEIGVRNQPFEELRCVPFPLAACEGC